MRTERISSHTGLGNPLLIVFFTLFLTTSLSIAQDCDTTVPTDFSTIQEAIDAAGPGETICVEPGTYDEALDIGIGKDGLTLVGDPDDISTVVLDGTGLGTVNGITVNADNITIRGFDIRNYGNQGIRAENVSGLTVGDNHLEGIDNSHTVDIVDSADVTIENVSIVINPDEAEWWAEAIRLESVDNVTVLNADIDGGFVGVNFACSPCTDTSEVPTNGIVQNSFIRNNVVDSPSGPLGIAILIANSTDAEIRGNLIEDSIRGVRVSFLGGTGINIVKNEIRNNSTFGISVAADDSEVLIDDNNIVGNSVGIWNDSNSSLEIVNSNISENSNVGEGGGGIFNIGGELVVDNTTIENNESAIGGGIYSSSGSITITRSLINGNKASEFGGGIFVGGGTLNILNPSTISNNEALVPSGNGGGIRQEGGEINLRCVTLEGNDAAVDGGGISTTDGILNAQKTLLLSNTAVNGGGISSTGTSEVNLVNVGLFENIAGTRGGGLEAFGADSDVEISFTTISENFSPVGSGSGIHEEGGASLTIRNSVLDNNTTGGNCFGAITDAFGNISSDGTCSFDPPGNNNNDPLIGPLQDNGGCILTAKPAEDSDAVDLILEADCIDHDGEAVEEDARGAARPDIVSVPPQCDAGFVELQQATGTIIIQKQVEPNVIPGEEFNFNGTGFPGTCDLSGAFTLEDDQSITCSNLDANTNYAVSETVPADFELNLSCAGGADVDILGGNEASIFLNEDEVVTCTFTNVRQVCEFVDGSPNCGDALCTEEIIPGTGIACEDFNQGLCGDEVSCDDFNCQGAPACEEPPACTFFGDGSPDCSDAACAGEEIPGTGVFCADFDEAVDCDADVPCANPNCEFAPQCLEEGTGVIRIAKIAVPQMDRFFNFTGTGFPGACVLSGSFSLQSGQSLQCTLPAGDTYNVAETLPEDLFALLIDCTGNSGIAIGNNQVSITLAERDVTVCTFQNIFDDDSGCALAPAGSTPNGANLLILALIPAAIFMRRRLLGRRRS